MIAQPKSTLRASEALNASAPPTVFSIIGQMVSLTIIDTGVDFCHVKKV